MSTLPDTTRSETPARELESLEAGATVSLVLPVLNEAENVEALIGEILSRIPNLLQVVVVDDGSTDGTRELVREIAGRDTRVLLVERDGPPSLTAAISEGILLSRGEWVGWMDADGTMEVEDLLRLTNALREGADIAVGSRFVEGGSIKGQSGTGWRSVLRGIRELRESPDDLLPVFLSWALNVVVLPSVIGDGVRDYTSGFIAGRRDILSSLHLEGSHGEYFIGLWAQARAARHRVREVPYGARPRRAGRSKSIADWRDYLVRSRQYLGAALRARKLLMPSSKGRVGSGEVDTWMTRMTRVLARGAVDGSGHSGGADTDANRPRDHEPGPARASGSRDP